ncbi:MAG: phosphoribosylaminoimidazolesuccinocarboxamide synthase [Pseudomonadota bacterium]
MNCLTSFTTPQLALIHKGKVRDSFRFNKESRMIVVTDRISAFDSVLKTSIPCKGAVLNTISNFWFEKTKDIIPNHLLKEIDPSINIVKEAEPIRVEMVVRNYLSGSMWRNYEKGKRIFSGVEVADGLTKNQQLPNPILTPTTKEESDREITPAQILMEGLCRKRLYKQMENAALALFKRGTEILSEKGIILVDTKYEFGIYDGDLILIDEIHTPDSSRFWDVEKYKADPENVEQMDKEFVRLWLIANKKDGQYPNALPEKVIKETQNRYIYICEKITGKKIGICEDVYQRVRHNLVKNKLIKDGYVILIMGSSTDIDHANKIKKHLNEYDIYSDIRVCSAHKNGEDILSLAEVYNTSVEPGAIVAIAGFSNGLGGALAANLSIPVFSCPPFKDQTDLLLNINSSLMMPSLVPAATVIKTHNAALAALRSLNLPRLKERFNEEIKTMKDELRHNDESVRSSE